MNDTFTIKTMCVFVSSHAACIRPLAGKTWTSVMRYDPWASNLLTVHKHEKLLHSGNLRKTQYMVLALPIGLLFLGQWQTLARSSILQQEKFRSLLCAMTFVKSLPKWDKCIRVMWDYVKKWYLSEIIVLDFMLLRTVIQIMCMT